ncbi:redoxin family protein [bacterium]|nr:redoxin family protein [bacterium]
MKSQLWFGFLGMALSGSVLAGTVVSPIELRDYHGQPQMVPDSKSTLTVIAFLGVECPLAKQYAGRLSELASQYADKGVAFFAVDANVQDSLSEMGAFVKTHGLHIPFIKDAEAKLADSLGAVRTPQMFIVDKEGQIRYQGRVDDQFGFGTTAGYAKTKVTRRDLVEAIDELLAGKPVSIAETKAEGCLIGRAPKGTQKNDVTYSNQIARLIQSKCLECHREGEAAPFPMNSYEEVVGWAPMMREVVDLGRMPPWFADPKHGHFKNDPRLNDQEKKDLALWIEAGCPEGNPKDLPAPKNFVKGWSIGQPDVVFEIPTSYQVPAEGVVDYQYFTVETNFTEDKWIQASEALPGNREVVHHIIVFSSSPNGGARQRGALGRQSVGGYAPGEQPRIYPEGIAQRIPAGSRLVFQMHYTPNGKAQVDKSRIGFKFADPATVKKAASGGVAINTFFKIPAGASNHRVSSSFQFDNDAMLTMLFPHMHLRGKSFRYEAVYPGGEREILLDVPRYDFNWQLRYELAEPKLMPKGTRIECVAHFDNSTENPANPDPTKPVLWGDQTFEEMMIGFFGTIPTDSDPNPLRMQRPGKPGKRDRAGK